MNSIRQIQALNKRELDNNVFASPTTPNSSLRADKVIAPQKHPGMSITVIRPGSTSAVFLLISLKATSSLSFHSTANQSM